MRFTSSMFLEMTTVLLYGALVKTFMHDAFKVQVA